MSSTIAGGRTLYALSGVGLMALGLTCAYAGAAAWLAEALEQESPVGEVRDMWAALGLGVVFVLLGIFLVWVDPVWKEGRQEADGRA